MLTKPPAQVQYYCTHSASNVRTQVNQIHANYDNPRVKFYMQIFSCIFACTKLIILFVFLVNY